MLSQFSSSSATQRILVSRRVFKSRRGEKKTKRCLKSVYKQTATTTLNWGNRWGALLIWHIIVQGILLCYTGKGQMKTESKRKNKVCSHLQYCLA